MTSPLELEEDLIMAILVAAGELVVFVVGVDESPISRK